MPLKPPEQCDDNENIRNIVPLEHTPLLQPISVTSCSASGGEKTGTGKFLCAGKHDNYGLFSWRGANEMELQQKTGSRNVRSASSFQTPQSGRAGRPLVASRTGMTRRRPQHSRAEVSDEEAMGTGRMTSASARWGRLHQVISTWRTIMSGWK